VRFDGAAGGAREDFAKAVTAVGERTQVECPIGVTFA